MYYNSACVYVCTLLSHLFFSLPTVNDNRCSSDHLIVNTLIYKTPFTKGDAISVL